MNIGDNPGNAAVIAWEEVMAAANTTTQEPINLSITLSIREREIKALDNDTAFTTIKNTIINIDYNQDSTQDLAEEALCYFEHAEHLLSQPKPASSIAVLGRYAQAWHGLKSSSAPQLKELKNEIEQKMVALVRQNNLKLDLHMPLFINECFAGFIPDLNRKAFEFFYIKRVYETTGDDNVTKMMFSMVLGHEDEPQFFSDLLNKVAPQSLELQPLESIDIESLGVDEYKSDEA